MDLDDLLRPHTEPQFAPGDRVMWCSVSHARPVLEFGTVIASGFHEGLYASHGEERLEYRVWEEGAGRRRFDLNPQKELILKAGADPYRECWSGDVEVRRVWHALLFSYDWSLNGADGDQVVADMERGVLGDSTDDHAKEAVVVLAASDRATIRINTYTLWDWAVGSRDVA